MTNPDSRPTKPSGLREFIRNEPVVKLTPELLDKSMQDVLNYKPGPRWLRIVPASWLK